jgi:hypothetical protein
MADTRDGTTEACPMCGSTYDNRKAHLAECTECGAEGSTACCMAPRVAGQEHAEECPECDQEAA